MGDVKPWHWIVIVLAVLVSGYTLWNVFTGPRVANPNSIMVADIETGEMFTIDTSGKKVAILPEVHPEHGTYTLFPVREDEQGRWVITPIMAETLAAYEGEAAAVTDRNGMVVKVAEGGPRPLN